MRLYPSSSTIATPRRRRPPAAELGFNRLAYTLLTVTTALALAVAGAYWVLGLTLRVGDAWLPRGAQAAVALVAWGYYFWNPGRPKEWLNAEASAAFLLCLLLVAVVAPAQYAAAALARPPIDASLAWADGLIGVHVPALVEWARSKHLLTEWLQFAYGSLTLQFTLVIPALWLRSDRRSLWEYTFNFHFTAVATVAASAIWPVACAFDYYGFESLVSQARFAEQFASLRAGTMTIVDMTNLEGLVSMPSFHAAGALFVTWALRQTWWLFVPVALFNLLLIASTVLTGAHYAVDVIAAVALTAMSVCLYRWIVEPWWGRRSRETTSA